MRHLRDFEDPIYSIARFVMGFLFSVHGAQKLFGALGATPATDPLMQIAGVLELFGGALVAVGLLTAPVAFVLSGEMAFAYFMAHAPKGPWPILNGGELAALYCFLFLYVSVRGPGLWSLDALLRRRRGDRRHAAWLERHA